MPFNVLLLAVSGSDAGKTYTVPATGVTIGRSRVNDICLNDGALSRQHCRIFFTDHDVMVQDLLSSNGTLLNGVALKAEPVPLQDKDLLTLGAWVFRVQIERKEAPKPVESTPTVVSEPPESINLFTPKASPEELNKTPSSPRLRIIIWLLGAFLMVFLGGMVCLLLSESPKEEHVIRELPRTEIQTEFAYEHISINAKHLFCYRLTYDVTTNELALEVDDLGEADRSFTKRKTLTDKAKTALKKMLMAADLNAIGERFPERSHNGVSVEKRALTIVRGTEVWQRVVENVSHPPLTELCEKLEFFARDELQVWAAQYSVETLETMARDQLAIADRYWEQRDLGDEKVWLAMDAYRKGMAALETLNPKPDCLTPLSRGFQASEALLTQRYEAVLFEVDQAMHTQRYDVASECLRRILRMIPDRDDARNRQASEKLLTVEQRRGTQKGGH